MNKTVIFKGIPPISVDNIFDISGKIDLPLDKTFLQSIKDLPFTINGKIQIGNSDLISWNSFDRSSHFINGTVVYSDITNYTIFTLKQYLGIFIVIQILHVFVTYIIKRKMSLSFKNNFSILEKIIHCIESTHLVMNAEEWDSPKGDAQCHIDRMKRNRIEGIALMLMNMLVKIGMLFPIYILGNVDFVFVDSVCTNYEM